jgi:hypothetical protein
VVRPHVPRRRGGVTARAWGRGGELAAEGAHSSGPAWNCAGAEVRFISGSAWSHLVARSRRSGAAVPRGTISWDEVEVQMTAVPRGTIF